MKRKWVTFIPLDKTPFADLQKSCINVLAAFGSVTVARINTCCYTGVVNVHGNLVKYIDEQETSVNICAAQRQKTNNSWSIEQRKCSSTEKTLKAAYYQSKLSCKMIGYKYIDGTDVLRKSQTPTINIFFKKSPRLKVANYLRKVASPQMLD